MDLRRFTGPILIATAVLFGIVVVFFAWQMVQASRHAKSDYPITPDLSIVWNAGVRGYDLHDRVRRVPLVTELTALELIGRYALGNSEDVWFLYDRSCRLLRTADSGVIRDLATRAHIWHLRQRTYSMDDFTSRAPSTVAPPVVDDCATSVLATSPVEPSEVVGPVPPQPGASDGAGESTAANANANADADADIDADVVRAVPSMQALLADGAALDGRRVRVPGCYFATRHMTALIACDGDTRTLVVVEEADMRAGAGRPHQERILALAGRSASPVPMTALGRFGLRNGTPFFVLEGIE